MDTEAPHQSPSKIDQTRDMKNAHTQGHINITYMTMHPHKHGSLHDTFH